MKRLCHHYFMYTQITLNLYTTPYTLKTHIPKHKVPAMESKYEGAFCPQFSLTVDNWASLVAWIK